MFEKICCTVVLYNPEPSTWININGYASRFAKLIVYDNSDAPDVQTANKCKVNEIINAVYLSSGQNDGISLSLNQAFKMALSIGFQYIITMDQDSFFSPDAIAEYEKAFLNFSQNINGAVLGMSHVENPPKAIFIKNTPILAVITSGSIFSLDIYKKVGPFNELLFIDWVDDEYCFRCRLGGFDVFLAEDIHLHHPIGSKVEKRHFLTWKKVQRSIHSPLRFYYMLRNFLFVRKMYAKKLKDFDLKNARKHLWYRFKNVLFYGKGIIVFYYAFRAILDYKRQRFGKFKK